MPRASRAQMEEHRRAVVDGAARLLRSSGPAAVTVTAVTASAGLTAGAFYKQFESKEALLEEACAAAVGQRRHSIQRLMASAGDAASARDALITAYLSEAHVDHPQSGCVVPALAADVARDPASPLGDGLAGAVDELVDLLAEADGDRDRALRDMVTLVGAVTVARATRGSRQSVEVLRVARQTLLER